MLKRMLVSVALLVPAIAAAQEPAGERFVLNTGPCTILSDSGVPASSSAASVAPGDCGLYFRTDTPFTIYYKAAGGTWTVLSTGGTVTSVAITGPTGINWSGSPVTTSGTFSGSIASGYFLPNGGTSGQLLRSLGAGGTPGWTTPTFPNAAASASYLRGDGTNWIESTLKLPNSATANRLLFATSTNTIGEDSDLTFSVDTLTATKAVTPTSLTTPLVYAYGAPKSLTVGGTGVAGCDSPPTGAGCEALAWTITTPFIEQRLSTDASYRTQWFVDSLGGHLRSYAGGSWLPLRLGGGPVQVEGGGLHVGATSIVDPGLGNSILDGFIGSPGYVSQTTGYRITADGAADFRYLFTDEMHAKKFIADVEIALLGGVFVTKSQARIAEAFLVPAKGSIGVLIVKDIPDTPDAAVFESGDTVSLRQFSRSSGGLSITNAHGVVTSYTDLADGKQSWNFQRYLGADGGAMAEASVTLPVDALVLDFGVSGGGYYEINAADGLHAVNSPYAQTVKWTGTAPTAANLTVTSRMGQLKGITGTSEYGFLGGTYGAMSAGRYIIFSDQHAEIHNVPLSLYNGANVSLYLNPVTSSFGQATSGADTQTFSTGTGCWSGIDAGVFKWRCGDIAGGTQYIAWNGTQLQVAGNIVVTGTSIDASTVTGVAGATVVSGAARGLLGIDANGNPVLPATATPSGSGFFLGSNFMGYYASGAWKTYMDNTGGFYLGGASGKLQWNGTTLAIEGNVVITGGSGYANISDKPTLGTLAALNSVAWGTHITGIPAPLGTPSGSGLFVSSTQLGYYNSGTWMTYMDNTGNFYLGGTSGKLQWNGTTLAIEGTVTATAGTIGGFSLGSDFVRDAANSMGLASTVTGGDDVRFWAGAAFASRASAPFRVTEAGAVTGTNVTLTSASGTVAIGSTGIAITPSTSANDARAYRWTPITISGSNWGLYGYDNSTTRTAALFNATGTTSAVEIMLQTTNSAVGGTTFRVISEGSGGNSRVTVDADAFQVTGSIEVTAAGGGNLRVNGVGLIGVEATDSNTGTVVVHAANGYYYELSSSERVKHIWDVDWKPSAANRATFLDQPSILFSYISNPGDPVIGFRAEGWQRADLPFMVNRGKDGEIVSYRQDAFLVYTHDVQRDHEARIKQLEAQIDALKGRQE
jgi:hypothetical protein